MRQTWILIIISIIFIIRTTIMFSALGTRYWCFRFAAKAFLSAIFLIINVYPWNKSNMDTYNNPHSFHYGHYTHVLHVGIHNIDAFDFQEKLFLPPFYIKLMFIREMSQTWILVTIFILLLWALQSSSPYWDTRYWCFRFARKAFLSTIFPIINVHPWNQSNLDTHNNLHFFLLWVLQSCSVHWDTRYWCFGFVRKVFLPPFSS